MRPKKSASAPKDAARSHKNDELTRSQIAKLLGASYAAVVRYEEAGKLVPTDKRDGVYYFSRAQAEALALERQRKQKDRATARAQEVAAELQNSRAPTSRALPSPSLGAVAADVFARFKRCEKLADIVIACKLEPWYVMKLRREYDLGFDGARKQADAEKLEREQARDRAMQHRKDREEEYRKLLARRLAVDERRLELELSGKLRPIAATSGTRAAADALELEDGPAPRLAFSRRR